MKLTPTVVISLFTLAINPSYSNVLINSKTNSTEVVQAETSKQRMEDSQVIGIIEAIDRFEISAADLVLKKNVQHRIKIFAHYLRYHHTKNLKEINALARSLGLKPTQSAQLAAIEMKNRLLLEKLSALNGSAFSVTYINEMVSGHQAALGLIDNQLLGEVTDPKLKKFVEDIRVAVQQHLDKALKIQKNQALQ